MVGFTSGAWHIVPQTVKRRKGKEWVAEEVAVKHCLYIPLLDEATGEFVRPIKSRYPFFRIILGSHRMPDRFVRIQLGQHSAKIVIHYIPETPQTGMWYDPPVSRLSARPKRKPPKPVKEVFEDVNNALTFIETKFGGLPMAQMIGELFAEASDKAAAQAAA